MSEYVFLDGEYIESDVASIPVRTHAFLYGTGVFEGIRAYYNSDEKQMYAFRMKEHYERLLRSAKVMWMNSIYSVEDFCNITKNLLKKNDYHQNVYIRPTLYKSGIKVGPSLDNNKDSFLIFTTALNDYFNTDNGLKLCVSNWRRNSDNAIPPSVKVTGAYANASLIKTDATMSGFDDAVVLNERGQVSEGSAMNLFFVKDGKLITTSSTDDILVGITRNTVIELAKYLGIEAIERDVNRSEVYVFDEVFACGTGVQVLPVKSIDHRTIGDGNSGVITKKIMNLYYDVVQGKVEAFKDWCTPIYD